MDIGKLFWLFSISGQFQSANCKLSHKQMGLFSTGDFFQILISIQQISICCIQPTAYMECFATARDL